VPGDQGPPSYDVLTALVVSLRRELADALAELEQARSELADARERIGELEARLKQTSRNSSKPPSSDGPGKPAPKQRSLRKRSGRRPGGQDGHAGRTLMQVATPDRQVAHEPAACGGCGASLAGRPVTGVERRQVFDLPPMSVEVTEHQLIERECCCGHRTKGAAPGGAEAPVQYGPRIAAIIIYLYIGQFLSKKRTAQALAGLFGTPLSSGTVAAITARAAGHLGGFLEQVREKITASGVVGFDETGFRVQGQLHWVHCARTGTYTLLTVHPRRGVEAMEAMGIMPSFAGVAVHDAWAPYDTYSHPDHQLCCAHALRELQAIADCVPEREWCWATQAAGALTQMPKLVSQAVAHGRDSVDQDALTAQIRLYHSAALIGISQTASRTSKLKKKHNALARRLLNRQDDYLRFTWDWRAPPDNNGCERDIRMTKLKQKVSGCLRTITGAKQFCAIPATYPRQPNTACTSSRPSSHLPKAGPGCQPLPDLVPARPLAPDQLRELILHVRYRCRAQPELERMAGHIQLEQSMRRRLASGAVAAYVCACRARNGDGGEVVDLEDPARLFADANGLIAPSEVASFFARIELQVRPPVRVISMSVAQRRRECQHPFAHLHVIADEVVISMVPAQVRNGETYQ
jgi:transposase